MQRVLTKEEEFESWVLLVLEQWELSWEVLIPREGQGAVGRVAAEVDGRCENE